MMHDWRPIGNVKNIPEDQPDTVATSEIDDLEGIAENETINQSMDSTQN